MQSKKYVCPRCNHSTTHKNDMYKHLYLRKKLCPNDNNLLLTEDIKETVLVDHTYHSPPANVSSPTNNISSTTTPANNFINTINYIGTINNFIVKLDTMDKLNRVLDYEDCDLISFAVHVENVVERDLKLIKNDEYKAVYNLDEKKIYKLIDEVTQMQPDEIEIINNLYDSSLKRVNLFMNQSWRSFLTDDAINRVMEIVQDKFLYEYEFYLIKKLHEPATDAHSKNVSEKYLENHYSFIAVFNLEPCMRGATDQELIGLSFPDKGACYISDKCRAMFNIQQQKLTKVKIAEIKKNVIDIIKTNTIKKIREINRKLADIMRIDDDYSQDLMITYKNKGTVAIDI